MKTADRILTLLMTHPSPEISIVSDNLIVCEFVPSHLARRIKHMTHVDSVTYSRYRLIVHIDTAHVRVSDSRITRVSTRKHEEYLNSMYQRIKEHNLYVPHRTPLKAALPSHAIRIGSMAKCVTTNGGMRPLH